MTQQTTKQHVAKKAVAQPRRRDVFFHLIKTVKLIGALIAERRIPIIRKVLFFGAIIGLLVILVFPDLLGELILSILPIIGNLLGIPLDAGFDWIAFALAIVSLLRIFPAEIVGEHYQRIFGKQAA